MTNSTRPIPVGIIGCGRVAGHHARSLVKIPQHFKLTAVCDLLAPKAEEMAKPHGVPFYTNYHQMLDKHPEIELVAVITPSGMHFEHAMEVIEQHGKSVVIEKPIVMTLGQGASLEKAAQKKGVSIFPVFQYRFNKAVQCIRNGVRGGDLGKPVLGTIRLRWCRPQRYYDRDPWRGTFALDGGACTNQGIHHLDLLRYLCGEVKRVSAKMATLGAKIEVEDTVVASVEFESGALGVIEITTAARPDDFESSISVVAEKGLAMVGGWATNELMVYSPDPSKIKTESEVFPDVYGFGHTEIYNSIYRAMRQKEAPSVEFSDAMRSIRLLHALYASDERGGWVELKDSPESKRLGREDQKLADIYRTGAAASLR